MPGMERLDELRDQLVVAQRQLDITKSALTRAKARFEKLRAKKSKWAEMVDELESSIAELTPPDSIADLLLGLDGKRRTVRDPAGLLLRMPTGEGAPIERDVPSFGIVSARLLWNLWQLPTEIPPLYPNQLIWLADLGHDLFKLGFGRRCFNELIKLTDVLRSPL